MELHGALGVVPHLLFFFAAEISAAVVVVVVFVGLVNLRVCGAIFFATRPWRTARVLRQWAAERGSAATLTPALLTFVLLFLFFSFLFFSFFCRCRGGRRP